MTRRFAIMAAVTAILAASAPGVANPPAQRDPAELATGHANRYVPKAAGTEDTLSLLFGPYTIPPGQDSNRITLDLPPIQGFITAVAPELVDASNGRIPTEQEAHIHHAHWFRVDPTGEHESYTAGLSWVFGTGEEKTQGLFEHRWAMNPDGPMYGVPVDAARPQVLIYMIHNKTSSPLNAYVVLDVRFIHGDEAAIEAANAGRDIRPMEGTLWGQTRDALGAYPELSATYVSTASGTIIAMGSHLHPGGKYTVVANLGPSGQCSADLDGDGFPGTTLLHSRKFDRIPGARVYSEDYQMGATKFGWRAPIREGDHLVQFAPYAMYAETPAEVPAQLKLNTQDSTPDYRQYTQEQWDAIRASDPGRYVSPDGADHAWYEAMTYTGMYVDRAEVPELATGVPLCSVENFRPSMLGEDTFEAQSQAGIVENVRGPVALEQWEIDAISSRYNGGIREGMINHAWVGDPDPLCGLVRTPADMFEWSAAFEVDCAANGQAWNPGPGLETDTIHVGGFLYMPGGLGLPDEYGAPARVTQGTTLRLINEDAALNIRHTFTSCPAPCNGAYVSNYPLPDGVFDTDKMGNVDPIDGGFSGDWQPTQELDTSSLDPGPYTYYCRIHPFMRGAFEVVAA